MNHELVYTSAPHGLLPNQSGYCTVAKTADMAPNLQRLLESLSAYRHVYSPNSEFANDNPVVYSHLIIKQRGNSIHVLSRIADAGLDYSNRNNKLAHHIVASQADRLRCGPTELLNHRNYFITSWSGAPRQISNRSLPDSNASSSVCTTWESVTGDAGWAGKLIEAYASGQTVYIVTNPVLPTCQLIDEAIRLLPPSLRWNATFSTYFTKLPPNVNCQWRCVIDGSPEMTDAFRNPHNVIIDITKNLDRASGRFAENARNGDEANLGQTPPVPLPTNYSSKSTQTAKSQFQPPPVDAETRPANSDTAMTSGPAAEPASDELLSSEPVTRQRRNPMLFILAAAVLMLVLGIIVVVFAKFGEQPSRPSNDLPSQGETIESADPIGPGHASVAVPPQTSELTGLETVPDRAPPPIATDSREPTESDLPTDWNAPKIILEPDAKSLETNDIRYPRFGRDVRYEHEIPIELAVINRPSSQTGSLGVQVRGLSMHELEFVRQGHWRWRIGETTVASIYVESSSDESSRIMLRWGKNATAFQMRQFSNACLEFTSNETLIDLMLLRRTLFETQSLEYRIQSRTQKNIQETLNLNSSTWQIDPSYLQFQLTKRLENCRFLTVEVATESNETIEFSLTWRNMDSDAAPLQDFVEKLAFSLRRSHNGYQMSLELNDYNKYSKAVAQEIQQHIRNRARIFNASNGIQSDLPLLVNDQVESRAKQKPSKEVKKLLTKIRKEYHGIETEHQIPIPSLSDSFRLTNRPRVGKLDDLMIDLKNQILLEKLEIGLLQTMPGATKIRWKKPRGKLESVLSKHGTRLQIDFNRVFHNLTIPIVFSSNREGMEKQKDYLLICFGENDANETVSNYQEFLRLRTESHSSNN